MDALLESAIDEAGRGSVFRRALELGWQKHDAVPKWVWWQIVGEIKDFYIQSRMTAEPRHDR